jgi:hypothetical protein
MPDHFNEPISQRSYRIIGKNGKNPVSEPSIAITTLSSIVPIYLQLVVILVENNYYFYIIK